MNKRNIIIIAIAIVMFALFINAFKQEPPLPAYIEESSEISSLEETTKNKPDVEMKTIINKELQYRLEIPKDWTYVLKNGYDTYIHSPSSTSVQIQVDKYNPIINNLTNESLSNEVMNLGGKIISAKDITTSSRLIIYSIENNNTLFYHIKYYTWDKANTICLYSVVKSEYYENMKGVIDYIVDSFNWNGDKIPDDMYMKYISDINFEFAVPVEWELGSDGNTIILSNSSIGASAIISISDNKSFLDKITQLDYTKVYTVGQQFMLQSFKTEKCNTFVTATFNNNNISYVRIHRIIANGKHQVSIALDMPYEIYNDDNYEYANTLLNLARFVK